jgi:hypothetical protein
MRLSTSRWSVIAWLAGILLVAAVVAPGAAAGAPTIERFNIDKTFHDDFLTAECGVDVTMHEQGHVIVRVFSGNGTGPAEITSLNLALTATANGNMYRFRDVGIDHVQITPDGTRILMIVGQIPFGFIGVLKINLETGAVIHEPSHSLTGGFAAVCAALKA